MKDIAKALCLFVVGLVVLVTLGDAYLKKRPRPTASSLIEARTHTNGVRKEEARAERPETPVSSSDYARSCAAYDPVAHPEQVIDILEYASEVTGTPVDILYSVWRKETGHFDGAGIASGKCDVMSELMIRDAAVGTHHAQAMRDMADRFHWGLKNMTCSCPGHDKVTGERKGYGGCCGPFQFSAEEVNDEYALPYNLDPMRFCDGALIAGWELKKNHDSAFTSRKTRDGDVVPGRGTVIMARYGYADREHAAWHSAMSRYYGGDEGGVYGNTAVAKWREFHEWHVIDERQPGYLVGKILNMDQTKYSLYYLRKLRASEPAIVASY